VEPNSPRLSRGIPTGWRQVLSLGLPVTASVAFGLGFACAMPFVALGAVAALCLSRRDALLVTVAAWLANLVVGFTVFSYPWTADTVAWGVALDVVALLATLVSHVLVRRLDGRAAASIALASFVGGFVVYEGGLYVVAATMLGGTEDFSRRRS
jgi:hypothetical protein